MQNIWMPTPWKVMKEPKKISEWNQMKFERENQFICEAKTKIKLWERAICRHWDVPFAMRARLFDCVISTQCKRAVFWCLFCCWLRWCMSLRPPLLVTAPLSHRPSQNYTEGVRSPALSPVQPVPRCQEAAATWA